MRTFAIFQEYTWLVQTIHLHPLITLAEINRRWLETSMSEGIEIARTTFIRHKAAIEDIFGIIIECDRRNDNGYYIANDEVLDTSSIQNWMLSTLSVNNILSDSKSVQDRILLETIPSGGDKLTAFIDAMKSSRCVTVTYRKYGTDTITTRTIEPYCVKLFNRRWYALVKHKQKPLYYMLSFDRILNLATTDEKFTLDPDFDAESHFSDCYGIVRNPASKLETIRIRAYGREVFYLRDLPFHHSQREVASGDGWTDFEYTLRFSADFYTPLLSRGPAIKVLEPQWLVDDIKRQMKEALGRYD